MSEPQPPTPTEPDEPNPYIAGESAAKQRGAIPGPNRGGSPSKLLIARLSAMQFLQFVPLGMWVVTLGTYIGQNTEAMGSGMFDASFVGISGLAGALGALVAPLLFGAVADGWFRSERLIALLNIGCAALLIAMWQSTHQWWFFAWMVLYYQFAVPAGTLANSLSLRHLSNSKNAFPLVRAFGTAGWVFALVVVSSLTPMWLGVPSIEVEQSVLPMKLALAAHLLMALYALTLPHTPPLGAATRWNTLLAGCKKLATSQPRLVRFLLVSFFATVSAQFYNMYANLYLNKLGIENAGSNLALGQGVEIACMLLLPWLLAQWGPKRVFVIGVAAWAVRYVCLAFGGAEGLPLVAVYVAILLHGVCFTFVYVVGYIYVDHASTPDTQAAAQGMLAVATVGIGHVAGSVFSGTLQAVYLTPEGVADPPYNWTIFFLIAAAISTVAVALFGMLMGFHREVMPGEVE